MIAGQLTRVQIGEIAVGRWWSFPYSCLTPTDYYCSSLRRILFVSSLFRLGRDRWTGQRPPGFFAFLLGGRLWEKGGIRKKEGVDVHAICLLVYPRLDSKNLLERFLPDGYHFSWNSFLLAYEAANPRGKSDALFSRVSNSFKI